MPEAASKFGEVAAGCNFGPPTEDVHGFPDDSARVAGLRADLKVQVTNMNTSAPVAGVKLSLIDPFTRKAVARPITDADGRFELKGMQVGTYEVVYERPWQAGAPGYKYLRLWPDSEWEEQLSVLPRT